MTTHRRTKLAAALAYLIATPGLVAAAERVVFSPDASGSMDATETERVLDVVAQDLSSALGPTLRTVDFLPWSSPSDVLSGPAVSVTVPPKPSPIDAPSKHIVSIFKSSMTHERTAAARLQHDQEARHSAQLAQQLAPVVAALRDFDAAKEGASTCLFAMLARLHSEPSSLAVVITDGADFGCGAGAAGKPAPTARVVVVMVTGRNDGPDALALRESRTQQILARFPSVVVVPSYRIRAGWLADILNESGSTNSDEESTANSRPAGGAHSDGG